MRSGRTFTANAELAMSCLQGYTSWEPLSDAAVKSNAKKASRHGRNEHFMRILAWLGKLVASVFDYVRIMYGQPTGGSCTGGGAVTYVARYSDSLTHWPGPWALEGDQRILRHVG